MGIAVDTVGFHATAAGATGKAATVSTGDSFTLRNFATSQTAKLVGIYRHDETATEGFVQLKSPRLLNDTTGVKVRVLDNPAAEAIPVYGLQKLYSSDTLVVNLSGVATATHTTAGAFQVYYSTLTGAAQRLKGWGTISGVIEGLFTQTVAVKTGAVGAWKTVLAKNTSDLMEADSTYALLGYNCDIAYMAVGIRAQETSTLRVVGPGVTRSEVTSWYYVEKSQSLGMPFIPVVNANNRGNINVTAIAGKATVTGKINLLWAKLSQRV